MKTCPKCHNKYEDTSDICPNCGAFYKKPFKLPSIFQLIIYFYVYGIGILILLASMISIKEDPVTSILGFIFFLSLIKQVYVFFFNKFNLNEKYMLLLRIILPLILLSTIFSKVIEQEDARESKRDEKLVESKI